MNGKDKAIAIIFLIVLSNFFISVASAEDDVNPCTYMKPDKETRLEWIESYERAPNAYIDPGLEPPRGSYSLLGHLNYIPDERDQGLCGNCWIWAGTGVLEIAMDVDENVKDRLSIQYPNSCKTDDYACCGGWLVQMADWYDHTYCIPWSNTNAEWEDGNKRCSDGSSDITCGSIGTSPNYPILDCIAVVITTHGVGKSAAIQNIKNVINQDKAVWFAYYLPTGDDWNNFIDFWIMDDESTIWNPDNSCGKEWDDGGGHAVLCVGYNDDDPENSYWIMVNSWGTNTNRSNGLFRLDMDMDYDCEFIDGDRYNSFYWQTLDVEFDIQQTYDPLTLTKEDNIVDCVEAGDEIEYQICFENTNSDDILNVDLIDYLPPEVSFVSATNGGEYHTHPEHTVTWDFDSAQELTEFCVYLTVKVNDDIDCITIENCCAIDGDDIDPTVNVCDETNICCPHPVPILYPPGIILLIGLIMVIGFVAIRRKE